MLPEGLAWKTLDALSSRLCLVDSNQRIIAANRAWREFLACRACRGQPASGDGSEPDSEQWVMPCWDTETASFVDQAIRDLRSGKQHSFSFEYECASCVPTRWYLMQIVCLPGESAGWLVIKHDDISERKFAEQAQQLAAVRLKQLGAHLESVREEQIAAIARELHDELGGVMTMLKLDLATTAAKVEKIDGLGSKFASLLEQVDAALQVIKRISTGLRPTTLDTLGLMATIRWHVERFSRASGISTELQLPDYVRLSDLSTIAVFRILQEGLNNVASHSGASKVSIQVTKTDGELVMVIIDNGHGITGEQLQHPESFGILGMSERAHYLGGQLTIKNHQDGGVCLRLCIPLDS